MQLSEVGRGGENENAMSRKVAKGIGTQAPTLESPEFYH